ncbi:MAG: Rpn family recombination-promoting nuclease/putative transposase [Lachnospiraceae bacterium]|nr:Rpn family recombination-promoting nuclease/putative transposase [Lachnospiraceae bacterium]
MGEKRLKKFEELMFRDDFMFGKVMEDSQLCREVLECLLHRTIGNLHELETQKEFRYTSEGKLIRLDVYNKDSNKAIYDTEMQNLNNKSIEWHQLPKRSRFYQGAIDIDYMNKGNSYKSLPECNILFLCTFDPFKKGYSQYTFHERCDENTQVLLEDGTSKIFYNCLYDGNDISDDLRILYEYINTGKPDNDLTKRIDKAVDNGRKNEVWRTQYMKEWVIIQDAIEEEREEKEKAQARAKSAEDRATKAEARVKELEAIIASMS